MTSAYPPFRSGGPVAGILYLAAIVILVDQVAILAASIYPISLDSASWRFGAVGLAAGRATPMLLADLLLLGAAMVAGNRTFLRVLAVLHLLLAAVLLAILGSFILDLLQVRQQVPLDSRRQLLVNAVRAAVALGVIGLYCIIVALRLFRATPPRPPMRSADRRIVLEGHAGAPE